MGEFTGKAIVSGIAIGKLMYYSKDAQQVKRYKISDIDAEKARYEEAKNTAIEQLNQIYEKALKEVGEVNASIFEVHAMMLEDEDYNDSINNIIESQLVNAEYAVACTGDNFSKMFSEMEDDYFKGCRY